MHCFFLHSLSSIDAPVLGQPLHVKVKRLNFGFPSGHLCSAWYMFELVIFNLVHRLKINVIIILKWHNLALGLNEMGAVPGGAPITFCEPE